MGNNPSCDKNSYNDNNNPGLPSFTFSSGNLTHDQESPLPVCCDNPDEYRAYARENEPERATGIYCKRCHAEWLDEDIYPFATFDRKDHIAVDTVKLKTANFDPCTSAAFNVSTGDRFLLTRRVTATESVRDLFRFLLMSIPQRTMIDRESAEMNSLRPGDHVMWHRPWACWHHQLIRKRTGRFKYDIVHFDTTDDQKIGFKVEVMERKARDFSEEHGTLYKVNYSSSIERENPEALVFDRANAKLHERGYSLLTHNCEHVISFCKTGSPYSYQGNWLKRGILFLILRILIISVVIILASVIDDKMSSDGEPTPTDLFSSPPVKPTQQWGAANSLYPPGTRFPTNNADIPVSPPSTAQRFVPVTSIPFAKTSLIGPSLVPHVTTTPLNLICEDGIYMKSQLVEGLVIPCLEIIMFVFVVRRHYKALMEQGIDRLDFTRRVGEAMFELVCTIVFYLSHIPIIYYFCLPVLTDIVIALSLGISGKIIGFFLGQYLCQKTVVKRKLKSLSRQHSMRSNHLLNASYDSMRKYSSIVGNENV